MNKKRNNFNRCKFKIIISLVMILLSTLYITPEVFGDSTIKLVIDGKEIIDSAKPFIENSRTLVPVRIISEELGANVVWNNEDRTVEITKGNRSVLLRIDSNLIKYDINDDITYNLSDAAPKIVKDRTFVPLRLISNALGAGIAWDNTTRTVSIDSTQSSGIVPFFDMKITSIESGQAITGTTILQSKLPDTLPKSAAEIRYMLIDPTTAKGFIIGRGKDLSAQYSWLPAVTDKGEKILVAALYDSNGKFLAGDAIRIQVDVIPQVSLTGIQENQQITADKVPMGADLNFSAAYVKYELINLDNGAVYLSPELDPCGTFNMIPVMEDNGNMSVRVIAYDSNKQPYSSQAVNIFVAVERKLSLGGVASGKAINGPVTLSTFRNFDVTETEYVMSDLLTGAEQVLFKTGYGNYTWFPGPDMKGNKEIFVRVKDKAGNNYESSRIPVTVTGTPKLLLQGIGPNQVVTGSAALKVNSNTTISDVKYTLKNTATGEKKVLKSNGSSEYTFTPAKTDAGTWTIIAEAINGGNKIVSEEVKFTIYTDNIYIALPIIEKSKFMGMASKLAKETMKKTGMSAALQTAQAILETGWGQSVPVDKYGGQFSNNLFGIKGTGTAGSVTSNTWEEYNGVAYRIDAKFRAYNNVAESWEDHNKLLLTADRYEIYRQVMHDSTQGAWALRRAGYATDSKYPMKLMEIINLYKLQELDRVGI